MPERRQQQIRVTEEQAKRLRRVARHHGLTVQTFALRALMNALAEAEEELREGQAQRRRQTHAEEATLLSLPSLENEPQGLGFRSRRERREAEKAERAVATTSILPAPTVVIQNGPAIGSAAHEATIAKLAAHIAAAPKWQRDMHVRGAVSTLQMLADSDAERAALAKRLDDLIEAEDKKRGAASNAKSVLGQLKGLFDLKM